MARGIQKAATVKNGYEMLLNQAIKSYEIWNNENAL
jgi:shikimate dehydrogenase